MRSAASSAASRRSADRSATRSTARFGARFGAVAGLVGALAGCAMPGTRAPAAEPAIADDFVRSRLVATDFVDVMAQLPELAPGATRLATPAPTTRFGELLFGALQGAGYDMRIGGGGQALAWTIEPGAGADARVGAAAGAGAGADGMESADATWTFLVSAGSVKLKRDYAVDVAGIRPVSRMLLHGADASAVVIDHTRFERAEERRAVAVAGERDATSVTAARVAVPVPAPAAMPVPAVATRAVPVTTPRGAARPAPRTNMYDTRRSAFAPILERYETLDKRVMVFGDDSLVMGAGNKRIAREIAARFDAGTDVVSLIGCSHGRTALENGNETLALGRAARVKEEFLLAGLDPELVLDEGCWAGQHFDKMPARGVVVTHKRRGDA